MKIIILLTVLFFTQVVTAQTDSVVAMPALINAEYAQPMYDPETGTVNLSYNYSGKWDLDGDNKKDSLFFIGNGGVHTWFYPQIVLSSDGLARRFPLVQLDMPYLQDEAVLDEYGKHPAVRFVICDPDKDRLPDIYLNFDNSFGSIPVEWRQKGIKTKYILMSFNKGRLRVRDY